MNTIYHPTMRLMIAATSSAIKSMSSIRAGDRPDDEYTRAIGRLDWMLDVLLEAAVAPVAIEPAREPERAP